MEMTRGYGGDLDSERVSAAAAADDNDLRYRDLAHTDTHTPGGNISADVLPVREGAARLFVYSSLSHCPAFSLFFCFLEKTAYT